MAWAFRLVTRLLRGIGELHLRFEFELQQILIRWISRSVNLQTFWFYRQHKIIGQSKLKAVAPITSARHFLT